MSVLWQRGNRELESKKGLIDTNTHKAPIDDLFNMKTSLEFNSKECKFCDKMTILKLIFAETKQSIGSVELDLGKYANIIKEG